jgi:RNA polymerase sigma-70 factor, ECF subfamily
MVTDEELISTYRQSWGDAQQEAVEELFRRHQARVVRWCCRFTRERESALDLSQEIFLRAFRNLESYRGECRFSTWLYAITRNLCTTAMQKRAVEPVWSAKAITADFPDRSSRDVHSQVEQEQSRQRSWRMILEALDETEAQVMFLHYGQELSLNDVSRMLELDNKSGAKAYIVSARRKLNAAIRPERPSIGRMAS